MTHRRYWVYFLLFMFNVICYLDRINMSVAGRSVAQEFGLSPVALGYLFSSFLWAYVVMMLPSGRLVDSLGPHRMAAIGATVWSVAQMLSGAATGFATMLLTRLGLGAGEAPTFPVSYRSVRDWAPYTERGLAVGLIQAGTLLGTGAERASGGLADRRHLLAHIVRGRPARSAWSGLSFGSPWYRRRSRRAGCRTPNVSAFSPSAMPARRRPRMTASAIAACCARPRCGDWRSRRAARSIRCIST